jgi:hypothetical protein
LLRLGRQFAVFANPVRHEGLGTFFNPLLQQVDGENEMPKRVLDFDALWASDKLASCAEWAQSEYAWLYGLADAGGSFEMTNLRVIWGRVAAIRKNLTLERLKERRIHRARASLYLGRKREALRPLDGQRCSGKASGSFLAHAPGEARAAGAAGGAGGV